MTCVSCNAELSSSAKFCPECGTRVGAANCPNCGEALKSGAKFCHNCGQTISEPLNKGPRSAAMRPSPNAAAVRQPRSQRLLSVGAFLVIPVFAGLIIALLFWKNREPEPLSATNITNTPTADTPAMDSKNELIYQLPNHWRLLSTPASNFRIAQAEIPGSGGSGELAVFFFGAGAGGSVQANLERWINQVEASDSPRREVFETNGLQVTWVEVAGTIKPSTMGMGNTTPQPNSRMFGAVVEGLGGPWFFKATGPDLTLRDERESFVAMLKSVQHKTLNRLRTNLKTNPEDLTSLDSLGTLYASSGSYEQARKYYERYLEIEPHNNTVKSYLAWAYYQLNRMNEAMSLVRGVLKEEPTNIYGLYTLGVIYSSEGKKDEAARHLQIIIDNYPGTEWAKAAQQLIHELTHVNNTSSQ